MNQKALRSKEQKSFKKHNTIPTTNQNTKVFKITNPIATHNKVLLNISPAVLSVQTVQIVHLSTQIPFINPRGLKATHARVRYQQNQWNMFFENTGECKDYLQPCIWFIIGQSLFEENFYIPKLIFEHNDEKDEKYVKFPGLSGEYNLKQYVGKDPEWAILEKSSKNDNEDKKILLKIKCHSCAVSFKSYIFYETCDLCYKNDPYNYDR